MCVPAHVPEHAPGEDGLCGGLIRTARPRHHCRVGGLAIKTFCLLAAPHPEQAAGLRTINTAQTLRRCSGGWVTGEKDFNPCVTKCVTKCLCYKVSLCYKKLLCVRMFLWVKVSVIKCLSVRMLQCHSVLRSVCKNCLSKKMLQNVTVCYKVSLSIIKHHCVL